MTNRNRAILGTLIATLLAAGGLMAGAEGRVSIRITDANGDPVQGAEVGLTNPQNGKEEIRKTDKKGKTVFLVIDATLTYGLRITKDGYQPMQDQVRPLVGTTLRGEFQLAEAVPSSGLGGGVQQPGEIRGSPAAIRLYNAGANANNDGDRATAVEKFQAAIEADPTFVPGHQALLGLHIQSKAYAEMLTAAEAYMAVAPTDPMALGARYDALAALGRSEEARAALERMILAAPGQAAAVRLFNRGATALREGRVETAIPDLKQAVAMDSTLAVARSALATVYLSQKEYRLAADNALVLREADTEDAQALSLLYDAYLGLGETEKAREVFAALEQISPEKAARAFYNQGVAHLDGGRAAEALASFEKVLQANPEHVKVHYMLGLAYLNTSRMAEAKSSLAKFLELAPDDPEYGATAKEMLAALE